MEDTSKTFYDLLSEISNNETMDILLSDNNLYQFKQLNAGHLKQLVESVVDVSLTQNSFNDTCNKIFKECLVTETQKTFNVVDRLLFVLEARAQSISPIVTVKSQDKTTEFDLTSIKTKIHDAIKQSPDIFKDQIFKGNNIEIECCLPALSIDSQLNGDLEKQNDTENINLADASSLSKLLGDAFINEIAKSIKSITIQGVSMDLSAVAFGERIKTVEMLPAALINNVVTYIEKYKEIVDGCTTVDGTALPIEGSLFSIR